MDAQQNTIPDNMLIVGFRDEPPAHQLLQVLHQLDQMGIVVLGHCALLTRDATGHVIARKEQAHSDETRAAILYGTSPSSPMGLVGMLAGNMFNAAVPLEISDELIHEVASWMPLDSAVLVATVVPQDVIQMQSALRTFRAGKLLYQTLPAAMAPPIIGVFEG